MVAQIQTASTFYPRSLPFSVANVGNADGTLTPPQGTEYQQPFAGSIIGGAWRGNGTLTTGTLTLIPTINGSLCPPLTLGTLQTGVQGNQQTFDARGDFYTFPRGAAIGAIWRKTGTVEPTTVDLTADIIVVYEEVRY